MAGPSGIAQSACARLQLDREWGDVQMPDGFGRGSRQKTTATSRSHRRPSIGLMALEPRVMYDGAAAATAVAAAKPAADGVAAGASGTTAALSGPSSAPAADHGADPSAIPAAAPTDSGHPTTPADNSGGTSAAPAGPASNAGHQVVFIDGN